MKYVSTSLSIGMVSAEEETVLDITPISEEQFVLESLNARSIVSNKKQAEQMNVKCNPQRITLKTGDILYVRSARKKNLENLFKSFMSRPTETFYKVEVCYI